MGVIYDIAGTSSDTFSLNGKLTFLQGSADPEQYQGQNGDVYFQTTGNIWVKINDAWINISSMALPKADEIEGKLLYSNGSYYVPTDFNFNDIALQSTINDFVQEAIFNNTATFNNEIEINGTTPHIDFHYNNSESDYTTRLEETSNGVISIKSSSGAQNNATSSTTSNEVGTKGWINDPSKSLNVVHRTGDEEIDGKKTFKQTIQGTAYRALWGDLAEYYESDSEYPKGTLVQFGGEKEITIATDNVNAVITSEPGFILNSQMENGQAIALCGRVPIRVIGKVSKFDLLELSEIPGVAMIKKEKESNIIARTLESKDYEEEGLVLCAVRFSI